MAWQDRQMPTSAQWDAARMKLLARVQSDREEADHCRLLEALHWPQHLILYLSWFVPQTERHMLFSTSMDPVLNACQHRCVWASSASDPERARAGLMLECLIITSFLYSLPGAVLVLQFIHVQNTFEQCYLQSDWPNFLLHWVLNGFWDLAMAAREFCESERRGYLTYDAHLMNWILRFFCSALHSASQFRYHYDLALHGQLSSTAARNNILFGAVVVLQSVVALVKQLFRISSESISPRAIAIALFASSSTFMEDALHGRVSLEVLDSAAVDAHKINVAKAMRKLKLDPRTSFLERKTEALVNCSNCSTTRSGTKSLQKCSHCGCVRYCGPACQKEHWEAHKTMCKQMRKLMQKAGSQSEVQQQEVATGSSVAAPAAEAMNADRTPLQQEKRPEMQ